MNKLELTRFPELDYACKEAINTLCTNLTFSGSDTRKIMLTSCQAHEGKSFLTLCITRTLAQLGYRVVLVDADLRRSQIASRYGMQIKEGTGRGTSHYLAGKEALENVIYETDVPGAYMVPVGYEVSNSLALLNSPRFASMLDQLLTQFDYVLVDAPPVGVIIDAAEIAKFCDGTVLVVKYNNVSRRELHDVKSQIDRSGCKILGVVINEVEFDSLSSKKYYNKHYYTHYDTEYVSDSVKKQRGKKNKK